MSFWIRLARKLDMTNSSESKYCFYLGETNRPLADKFLVEQISKMDQKWFPFPWGKSGFDILLENSTNYALGTIEFEESIVGWGLFLLSKEEKLAHLLKILVLPTYRRKSYGKLLLDHLHHDLKKLDFERVYLEVESDNRAAQALYLSSNYRPIHLKKDFYGSKRDAVIMEAIL